MNVSNVGKLSGIVVPLCYMKEVTLERDPMNVSSVVRPSPIPVIFKHMKESTVE
jgi:hypothetical protein